MPTRHGVVDVEINISCEHLSVIGWCAKAYAPPHFLMLSIEENHVIERSWTTPNCTWVLPCGEVFFSPNAVSKFTHKLQPLATYKTVSMHDITNVETSCLNQFMVMNFSFITEKHSKLFSDLWQMFRTSLSVFITWYFPFILMLMLSHLNSSVCLSISSTSNPILLSLFPVALSVHAQSPTSHLRRLFKDGCAGGRAVGWSDGLCR